MMQVADRRTQIGPMSPTATTTIMTTPRPLLSSPAKVNGIVASSKSLDDKSGTRVNLWASHSDDNALARTQQFLIETYKNPVRFIESESPVSAEVPYTPINDRNLEKKSNDNVKSPSIKQIPAISSGTVLSDPPTSQDGSQDKGEGSSKSVEKLVSPSEHLFQHRISLHPSKEASEKGVGLVNKGNTCYMNSTLQALIHLPPLSHALLSYDRNELYGRLGAKPLRKFDAIGEMASLTRRVLVNKGNGSRPASPDAFLANLKSYAAPLRKFRQEDAHEFLRFLLDALQLCSVLKAPNSLKSDDRLRETTLPYKIFGGKLRSRVQCQQCKHTSDTFEGMLDISLNLKGANTIREALEKFTTSDSLTGDEKYRCEKCKRSVDATKRFTIHEPPVVLTLSLKRFSAWGAKYSKQINYAESLELTNQMLSEGLANQYYRLRSIIHHRGSTVNSGHYVASVKGHHNQRWYEMDDDSVYPCREVPINSKDAYILFYVRDPGRSLDSAVGADSNSKMKRSLADADDYDRFDKRFDYSSSTVSSPSTKGASQIKRPILAESMETPTSSSQCRFDTVNPTTFYNKSPSSTLPRSNGHTEKKPMFRNMGYTGSDYGEEQNDDDTGEVISPKTEVLYKKKKKHNRKVANHLGVRPNQGTPPKVRTVTSPYKIGYDTLKTTTTTTHTHISARMRDKNGRVRRRHR